MSQADPLEPEQASRRSRLTAAYVLLGIVLVSCGYLFGGDLKTALGRLEAWIVVLGPAAPIAMAVICGLWGVLCLPGPLMQGTVGTLFAAQPPVALAVVVVGETLAQAISFLLGRFVGRDKVQRSLGEKPWFRTLEEETAKKGFYGVLLFRLMPFFPNALASYAFGLTSLRFGSYLVASVVGSFPKMVMYIYGTTSFVKALKAGTLPGLHSGSVIWGGGLLLLVLIVRWGYLAQKAKKTKP